MTDPLDALAKPPPPPSELDELMSRDPLELAKEPGAIDKIIAYQRQARAMREAPAGSRRKKDLVDMSDKPLDLTLLGLAKPKTAPAPALKPAGGGFRRM
jgi:hypothetical protein